MIDACYRSRPIIRYFLDKILSSIVVTIAYSSRYQLSRWPVSKYRIQYSSDVSEQSPRACCKLKWRLDTHFLHACIL